MTKVVRKIHRIVGLVMVVHVATFVGSGLILLFIGDSQEPAFAGKLLDEDTFRSALSKVSEVAKDKQPVLVVRSGNNLSVRMNTAGVFSLQDASRHTVPIFSSTQKAKSGSEFAKFVLEVHRDFGFGKPGKSYMTYIAVIYLLLILSGIGSASLSLWRKVSKNLLRRNVKRLNAYMTHNFVGLLLAPFLLFMGITGLLLYLKNDLFADYRTEVLSKLLTDSVPTTEAIDGASALGEAQSLAKGMPLYFMAYPGNDYAGEQHFAFVFQGRKNTAEKKMVLVDRYSRKAFAPEAPALVKAAFYAFSFHAGNFGPVRLRYVWSFFGCLTFFIIGSGVLLVYRRYRVRFRRKKKPPPSPLPLKQVAANGP